MQARLSEPTVIDPEAVAAFYARHPGSEGLVRLSVRLVQETFPEIVSLSLKAVRDPEEDAEWVRVKVLARLGPDALRDAYRAYGALWIAQAPGETSHLVRLWHQGG